MRVAHGYSYQGDGAKNKMKVWQNKSKGAKKAAKSKKKKLTKKKPVSQQQVKGDKAKQANGNVAGNVSGQSWFCFSSEFIACLL